MRRALLVAALLLPLVWLGTSIARHRAALDEASLWRIPISGYDPRDPLRGRYIQFSYAWDTVGDSTECDRPAGCDLCLERSAGTVRAVITPAGTSCPTRVDPHLSRIDISPALADQPPRFISRLFVSETSAPVLEQQLRDRPMVVVAALTPDGRLVNRRLEPGERM
jgi:hypothetical protein